MNLIYESICAIPVTGGTLFVEKGLTESQWRCEAKSLDLFFDADYKLRYSSEKLSIQMNGLEELAQKSRKLGFDIESEIRGNPHGWAKLISGFLGLPEPLHKKEERPPLSYEMHGIDSDALPLSIIDGMLRWHGLFTPLNQPGQPTLYSFNCSIETLKVEVTKAVVQVGMPNNGGKTEQAGNKLNELMFSKFHSVRFGPGELAAEFGFHWLVMKHYNDESPQVIRFTYSEGQSVCRFNTLGELIPFAEARSISTEAEAAANPAAWAELVSGVHYMTHPPAPFMILPVVRDTPIYRHQYKVKGVDYDEFKPKVDRGKLIWCAVKEQRGGSGAKRVLLQDECDLSSFAITSTEIRDLPKKGVTH